jgi:hypothetical protein
MSFDIFLQCFRNGKQYGFPFALVERGFGPYKHIRNDHCWILAYPDGGHCELFVDTTKEHIEDFMVSRPPASPEFWGTILELLQQTSSCLYWPGGGPAIAYASVRNHLPPDMIESLGEPTIVSSPEQIVEAIKDS